MTIDLNQIIPVAIVAWYTAERWISQISKVLEPVVQEMERLAQDGVIDKADRKMLALKAIEAAQAKGLIKLNFFSRLIVNKVVDRIAARLPDFKVTKNLHEIVAEAQK